MTAAMTVLHGPIRDGSCTGLPRAARRQGDAKLLVESFPATAYVPYTDTAYALCFSCHERDLLQYPDTSFATGFRDGERNLHYLHVNNAQKGRSCVLCHNLHGGTNDALIAESVPSAAGSCRSSSSRPRTAAAAPPAATARRPTTARRRARSRRKTCI